MSSRKAVKRRRESDDESAADQTEGNSEQSSSDRVVRKICKHFSRGLVDEAVSRGWEVEEIARLMTLLFAKLDYSDRKALKFLAKCDIRSPAVFAAMEDEGMQINTAEKVRSMYTWSSDLHHFIELLREALDLNALEVTDPELSTTIIALELSWTNEQRVSLIAALCAHSESKRACGQILASFVEGMEVGEAAGLVYDVVTFDFFMELKGKMKDLMREMPLIECHLKELLASREKLDEEGDIIDSDDDGKGNLEGFVTYSDNDESCSAIETSESENGSESSDERGSSNSGTGSDSSPLVVKKIKPLARRKIIDDSEDE